MVSISYCITTHNEGAIYLEPLLQKLLRHLKEEDEIVIVDDYSDEQSTLETFERHKDKIKLVQHKLNNDFAAHKNFAKDQCTKQYIFFIDADENLHENLLLTLKEILLNNHTIDMFLVPRVNVVTGLTTEHIQKWGWQVNDKQFVNYPDFQTRIIVNSPKIKWEGKVHERLVGHDTHAALPTETQDYCLLHIKEIARQEAQNEFYEKIY
jgi:glycosyltransferase involved in cell wall biosynthesis